MAMSEAVQATVDALIEDGWALDKGKYKVPKELAHNGPYEVLARLKSASGKSSLMIEQNTSTDEISGLRSSIEYPPVAVIEHGIERVACNPEDLELIKNVTRDLEAADG